LLRNHRDFDRVGSIGFDLLLAIVTTHIVVIGMLIRTATDLLGPINGIKIFKIREALEPLDLNEEGIFGIDRVLETDEIA
jgi:hypothetical protein